MDSWIHTGVRFARESVARHKPDPNRPSWVYFAAKDTGDIGDLVKIGVSTNPDQRMAALSYKVGFRPKILALVPGSYDVEMSFHDAFFYTKHKGEWYVVDDRLKAFIEDCQQGRVTVMPPEELPSLQRTVHVEREVHESPDSPGDTYYIDKEAGSRWYDASYQPAFWNGRVNHGIFHLTRTDLHEKAVSAIQAHAERTFAHRRATRPAKGK